MALSPEYRAYVTELFEPVFPVRIKFMFGGAGLYRENLMFGLLDGDRIYLKADEISRGEYEAAGSEPFIFRPKTGEVIAMSYMSMPDACYDDRDELEKWANKAFQAALRSRASKHAKQPAPRNTATKDKNAKQRSKQASSGKRKA